MAGATVTAQNVETGVNRSTTTAGDGSCRLSALPVGRYEAKVEQSGSQTGVRHRLDASSHFSLLTHHSPPRVQNRK